MSILQKSLFISLEGLITMVEFLRKLGSMIDRSIDSSSISEFSGALEELRNSAKQVSVRFEGDDNSYTCSIGAFNMEHHVVVINNIYPEFGVGALRRGGRVNLAGDSRGLSLNMDCSYIEPLIGDEKMALQLKLPKRMELAPSRRHFLAKKAWT